MKQNKLLKILSCCVFAGLYLLVAVISLICSTEFFALAHSGIMSWTLAIGFEVGAMACLLSTLILPKNKLGLVWFMFVALTLFQCMSNTFMAYQHIENFQGWIELFGMTELEPIAQKRILASISGAILPLVALGFIRIMADVIQGTKLPAETEMEEVDGTEDKPKEIENNAEAVENETDKTEEAAEEQDAVSEGQPVEVEAPQNETTNDTEIAEEQPVEEANENEVVTEEQSVEEKKK